MARATTPTPEGFRRCIGSVRFGIPAHDAPVSEFNPQPSQPGGLARMCKTDWSKYTRALRTGSTEPQPRKKPERTARGARLAPEPIVVRPPKPARQPRAARVAPVEAAAPIQAPQPETASVGQPGERSETPAAKRMRDLRARRKLEREAAAAAK